MATKPGSTLSAIAALAALILLVATCAEEEAGEASGPAPSRGFNQWLWIGGLIVIVILVLLFYGSGD